MDAMFAFPSLLLAILIAFLLRGKFDFLGASFSGIMSAAISITVIYIPQYFRVIRNSVISVREEPYVEAARVLGAEAADHHRPLRVRQRHPERPGHRHA